MDLLEKEVSNDKSPIWNMNYEVPDAKIKIIFRDNPKYIVLS